MIYFAQVEESSGRVLTLTSGTIRPCADSNCRVIESQTPPPPRPENQNCDLVVRPDGSWCWVGRDFTPAEQGMQALEARTQRNRLLAACDWTQGKDALGRITKAQQTAWAVYRQALCDLTDQPGFPLDIQWPTRPG